MSFSAKVRRYCPNSSLSSQSPISDCPAVRISVGRVRVSNATSSQVPVVSPLLVISANSVAKDTSPNGVGGPSSLKTSPNPTGFTETLSDVGFLLSGTHIPLDSLNFGGEPPPGVPGSMFDLLASLDGTTLCPNCSLDITLPAPIPELPVWFMLCGGLAGLIGLREFRRTANPRSDAAIRRKPRVTG